MITTTQAAQVIGTHKQTVIRFAREGKLKAAKIGKSWHIKPAQLRQFFLDHWAKNMAWKDFLEYRLTQEKDQAARKLIKGLLASTT